MPLPDFAQGIQYSFLDTENRARIKAHAAARSDTSGASTAAPGAGTTVASANDLTFDDLVDVVNPLQHLPVISTFYRHFAHDPIRPLPKIAGDALYGGWMGLASSVADYAFEKITGKNFGDTVLALVTGEDSATDNAVTRTAAATTNTASSVTAAPVTKTAAVSPIPNPTTEFASPSATAAPTSLAATNPTIATPPPSPTTTAQIPDIDAATMDAFMAAVNSKGINGDLGARTLDAYRRTLGMQTSAAPAAATVH
jgi:hypothetical protein